MQNACSAGHRCLVEAAEAHMPLEQLNPMAYSLTCDPPTGAEASMFPIICIR